MKPTLKLASTQTPDGGKMILYQHDQDFSILVNGDDLMHSRQHESELELARLGCAQLCEASAPRVLIGGLGMGYTLRQVLDMLPPGAEVVVGELLEAVVEWNRDYLGVLNGHPVKDPRTKIHLGDVVELIAQSPGHFDAILLDIDNGPNAITDSDNGRLYEPSGLQACRRALRSQGMLAIWSTEQNKPFERLIKKCGFFVQCFRVEAYPGSKRQSRYIWLASENRHALPTRQERGEPHRRNKPIDRRPRKR